MDTENKRNIEESLDNRQMFAPDGTAEIVKQKEASEAIQSIEQQAVPDPEAVLNQPAPDASTTTNKTPEAILQPIEQTTVQEKVLEDELIHKSADTTGDASEMVESWMGKE